MNRTGDDQQRATALAIQRRRPGWMVVWGVYSRQYVAFALVAMRRRVIITAGYPDALVARIDEAERRWRARPPGSEPAPDRSQSQPVITNRCSTERS